MAMTVAQAGKQFSERVSSAYLWPRLPWVIIGFGILVRLLQYLRGKELWVDEAALALNIGNRSFAELLQPLDFITGAPVGFLMLVKLATEVLGNNEFSLRLFPLLAGIGSLLIFYAVVKQYLTPRAIPVALTVFATSTSLVRFSSFLKQYSVDVFAALLMLLLTVYVVRSGLSNRWLMLYALAGALLVWFSHPIALVLAGFGLVLGVSSLRQSDWRKVFGLAVVSAIWLASFIVSYQATPTGELVNIGIAEHLDEANNAFVPSNPFSFEAARWFTTTLFGLFYVPVGIYLTGLAALTFILGCMSCYSTDKNRFFLLVSPLVITMVVSAAHLYPFQDRWILFLVPFAIIFIAQGAISIYDKTRRSYPALGVLVVALLLLHPLASEAFRLVEPRGSDEVRTVMGYVSSHRSEGDVVYVYHGARKSFWYYADRYGFEPQEHIVGVSGGGAGLKYRDLNNFTADLDQLRGNERVWLLFSNVQKTVSPIDLTNGINEEQFMVYYLDNIGTRKDQFRIRGSSVYLYDLSSESVTAVQTPSP